MEVNKNDTIEFYQEGRKMAVTTFAEIEKAGFHFNQFVEFQRTLGRDGFLIRDEKGNILDD